MNLPSYINNKVGHFSPFEVAVKCGEERRERERKRRGRKKGKGGCCCCWHTVADAACYASGCLLLLAVAAVAALACAAKGALQLLPSYMYGWWCAATLVELVQGFSTEDRVVSYMTSTGKEPDVHLVRTCVIGNSSKEHQIREIR
ncbi:uncharacterized protein LOC122092939 [Macadamia integrifolia]|uniref:uncharacterized protein LOC122092939 n=1 Tax=Macadamia integrifolia TaxID=60698 RepID=UPI001C52E57F|nr:uncharacterized protein LOC122092939 [Macadamia integrifolia]